MIVNVSSLKLDNKDYGDGMCTCRLDERREDNYNYKQAIKKEKSVLN